MLYVKEESNSGIPPEYRGVVMTKRVLGLLALVIVVMFSFVACGSFPDQVHSYCDNELSYKIYKYDSHDAKSSVYYTLDLHVGNVTTSRPCGNLDRDDDRAINLTRPVATLEEANKLIEKTRAEYVAKIDAEKLAATKLAKQAPQ